MTRLDILNSRLEMANYNLDCYSRVDIVGGKVVLIARSSCEKEWLEVREEVSILHNWIYELKHA